MLLFCNVSLRLTSDTLSHVNNESDDLHVQGIEETCWHMVERMKRAESTLTTPRHSVSFLSTTSSSTTFSYPQTDYLTSWFGHFWLGQPCFQFPVIHDVSITNTSVQGKNDTLGNGWIKQEVLRGRWSMLASGCSSQLFSDLEYTKKKKKIWETLSLWGPALLKKKRKIHLSFMNNSNTGLQLLKYTEGGLRLLLAFHSPPCPPPYHFLIIPPTPSFLSNLVSCENKIVSECKQSKRVKVCFQII